MTVIQALCVNARADSWWEVTLISVGGIDKPYVGLYLNSIWNCSWLCATMYSHFRGFSPNCTLQSLTWVQYWNGGVSSDFWWCTSHETRPFQYHVRDCSVQLGLRKTLNDCIGSRFLCFSLLPLISHVIGFGFGNLTVCHMERRHEATLRCPLIKEIVTMGWWKEHT